MSDNAAAILGDNSGADAGAAGNAPASNNAPSWTEGLSEDLMGMVEVKGWKGPEDVLTSYRNLEKFAGGSKKLVELPGEDANEESLNSFYSKLGRPESPDKYEFNTPDDADADLDQWFRSTAHKHGLSAKQAAALYDDWNAMSAERMSGFNEQQQMADKEAIAALRKEWGTQFDANIDAGRNVVKALGLPEDDLKTINAEVGTATMLKLFATLGAKMGESGFEGSGNQQSGFGMSPAAAKQSLEDLRLDKEFMSKYLSGDKDAVAKFTRLNGIAYG